MSRCRHRRRRRPGWRWWGCRWRGGRWWASSRDLPRDGRPEADVPCSLAFPQASDHSLSRHKRASLTSTRWAIDQSAGNPQISVTVPRPTDRLDSNLSRRPLPGGLRGRHSQQTFKVVEHPEDILCVQLRGQRADNISRVEMGWMSFPPLMIGWVIGVDA